MNLKLIRLILILLIPIFAYAKGPDIITFGVYPVSIYDLDPANSSFTINFYAWWRTKDKNYNPEKSVEIVNSRDYVVKYAETDKVGDEYNTFIHYFAKVNYAWNSKYFPFGRQYLQIKMEDFSDIKSVIFKPDYEQSKLHSELVIPGWQVVNLRLKDSLTTYTTNFGDISTPQSQYSRLTFTIEVRRHGWKLYMSYFIGFFMAGILTHLLYLMSSFPFAARATTFMGGVISFIGNKYVIDQKMPPTSDYTLADSIQVATFICIITSIILSIIIEMFEEKAAKRKIISHIVGITSLICYISYIAFYTYSAVTS